MKSQFYTLFILDYAHNLPIEVVPLVHVNGGLLVGDYLVQEILKHENMRMNLDRMESERKRREGKKEKVLLPQKAW